MCISLKGYCNKYTFSIVRCFSRTVLGENNSLCSPVHDLQGNVEVVHETLGALLILGPGDAFGYENIASDSPPPATYLHR